MALRQMVSISAGMAGWTRRGGVDKARAGFTARVVVITETDGMDVAASTSREADKITQIEARTRAYGARKRIYMECTVSTETGRTWREYMQSTRGRIMLPCPHCRAWVAPEREHLTGWQGAESQEDARRASAFSCPACGEVWTHQERIEANQSARLLHGEQTMTPEGEVEGEVPPTDTLGFRWSAVNNLFLEAGDFAADEWRTARSPDEENAEREMRQFVWCVPVAPQSWSHTLLEANEITARQIPLPRGVVPKDSVALTAALDIGKYLNHWIVVAWSKDANPHVVDYGRMEVASADLGVEQAVLVALREFRAMILDGWPQGDVGGETLSPSQVWIDAGYVSPVIYAFCRESGTRFRPSLGRGTAQRRQSYSRPTKAGTLVHKIGEGYHASWVPAEQLHVLEVDADHWKSWVHQRLSTPLDRPGALTLFQAAPQEHFALAKHLTAEVKTESFAAGKGVVITWERLRRQNHWLDALYNACAAGHSCGVRLVLAEKPDQTKQRAAKDAARPATHRPPRARRPKWMDRYPIR